MEQACLTRRNEKKRPGRTRHIDQNRIGPSHRIEMNWNVALNRQKTKRSGSSLWLDSDGLEAEGHVSLAESETNELEGHLGLAEFETACNVA